MSQFDWIGTPDGYMMPGQHATTPQGSEKGQTAASIYLLHSKGELGLIDTGMGSQGVQELIDRIHASGGRLRWIVLTHFHYDHIGNAAFLARRYACMVLAHPLDIPAIENPLRIADGSWGYHNAGTTMEDVSHELGEERNKQNSYRIIKKYFNFPVHVHRPLKEGDILELGDLRLKVLHTPGHSPGSISMLNPANGSLYIGDLDYCLNPSNPWPIGDASDLIAGIHRVLDLDASFLGPGHYLGIFQDWSVREYLEEMLQRTLAMQQRVETCLNRMGPSRVDQLAEEVFPVIPRYAYPPLPKNAVHCFLHKLRQEGKVRKVQQGEEILWELVQ